MEAIIFALTVVSAALLLSIHKVRIQRNKAQELNVSSAKKMDGLKMRLNEIFSSAESDEKHLAELEQQLAQEREKTKYASELIVSLRSELDEAQKNTRTKAQQNADLVAQVKALSRKVDRLRKEISDLEMERESRGQTEGDLTETIADLKVLLDAERQTVRQQYNRISVLESELKVARQDDEAAKRILRLEEQLKEAQRELVKSSPRSHDSEADLSREVERLSRVISKLESEVNQARLKESAESERAAALESELSAVRLEFLTIEAKLSEANSIIAQGAQDKAKLESELKQDKQIDRSDAQQLTEMKSKLEELNLETCAKARCITNLESKLKEAQEKANQSEYDFVVKSVIGRVTRNEDVFKSTIDGHSPAHGNARRETNILRHAKYQADLVHLTITEAVEAILEAENGVKSEAEIKDNMFNEINAGIRFTGLTVQEVIRFIWRGS